MSTADTKKDVKPERKFMIHSRREMDLAGLFEVEDRVVRS